MIIVMRMLPHISGARISACDALFWMLFAALNIFPMMASAQALGTAAERLVMTLTPPLYQLTLSPGTEWSSTLHLKNENDYPLSLFATIKNFRASGESGTVLFDGESNGTPNAHELASWITIPKGTFTAPTRSSAVIPFTISVPADAEPGGHYAAILVGSQPGDLSGGAGMSVGSLLSALFLVRITGDVIEDGEIVDFFSERFVVESQEALLHIRFENRGNVHLVPVGDVVITNMFGRERGRIIINDENSFGNVLPGTTRKFSFQWKGERNFFDIGRYTALATLAYGEDGRKTVFRSTHIWVIPWMPLALICSFLIFFVWFVRRVLRRYIDNAILLERERLLGVHDHAELMEIEERTSGDRGGAFAIPKISLGVLRRPIERGLSELRSAKAGSPMRQSRGSAQAYLMFMRQYRTFFISLLIVLCGFSTIGWYFYQVFEEERSYRMTIKKEGAKDIPVIAEAP